MPETVRQALIMSTQKMSHTLRIHTILTPKQLKFNLKHPLKRAKLRSLIPRTARFPRGFLPFWPALQLLAGPPFLSLQICLDFQNLRRWQAGRQC